MLIKGIQVHQHMLVGMQTPAWQRENTEATPVKRRKCKLMHQKEAGRGLG